MSTTILLQSFVSEDQTLKVQTFYNQLNKSFVTETTYKHAPTKTQTYKTKKLHYKRIEYYKKIYNLLELELNK